MKKFAASPDDVRRNIVGMEVGTEKIGHQTRYLVKLTCAKCGDTHSIGFKYPSATNAEHVVARKFSQAGWWVGSSSDRASDLCPKHRHTRKTIAAKIPEVVFPGTDQVTTASSANVLSKVAMTDMKMKYRVYARPESFPGRLRYIGSTPGLTGLSEEMLALGVAPHSVKAYTVQSKHEDGEAVHRLILTYEKVSQMPPASDDPYEAKAQDEPNAPAQTSKEESTVKPETNNLHLIAQPKPPTAAKKKVGGSVNRVRLPQNETIKIYKFLETVLVKLDSGLWSYKDGLDDVKVAKRLGGKTTVYHVRGVRANNFGAIKTVAKRGQGKRKAGHDELETLVLQLMDRVEALEARLK